MCHLFWKRNLMVDFYWVWNLININSKSNPYTLAVPWGKLLFSTYHLSCCCSALSPHLPTRALDMNLEGFIADVMMDDSLLILRPPLFRQQNGWCAGGMRKMIILNIVKYKITIPSCIVAVFLLCWPKHCTVTWENADFVWPVSHLLDCWF